MDLESPHFDVLWLKIYLPTTPGLSTQRASTARSRHELRPAGAPGNPTQVESHQYNQEATSHTQESMVSKDETWEAGKETDRFLTSLAFSRVIEVTPGGTEYSPGKEEEEVRYYLRCLRPGTGRNPCTAWSSKYLDNAKLVSSRSDRNKGEIGR